MEKTRRYKLNIADLPEKEIDHELEKREMEKSGTLDEKLKRLIPILRDEGESVLGYNLTRTTIDEIDYCSNRVAFIEQELAGNPGNHYELKSSLIHCYSRIKRVKTDISNKEIVRNILSTCEENLTKYFPLKTRKNSAKENTRKLSLEFDYSCGETSEDDSESIVANKEDNNPIPQNCSEAEKYAILNLALKEN